MKAMILAAGLGTRLLPLTEKRPKPLFPILGRPLIDILIHALQEAGCDAIIINTHHLAHMIDEFVKAEAYGIPVVTRYEPTILGTGGGIKNVEDFWDDEPFIVVNGDIATNIDFGDVYRFHLNHQHTATLVLHDCSQFNHVWVDSKDHIRGFGHTEPCPPWRTQQVDTPTQPHFRKLAFTGIHILDPQVLQYIPKGTFSSIIHAYCKMLRRGLTLKGFVAQKHYWQDIGTLAGHQEATRDALARKVYGTLFPGVAFDSRVWSELKGDGSDRTWYRVTATPCPRAMTVKNDNTPVKDITGRRESRHATVTFEGPPWPPAHHSLILVDHGPPAGPGACEADSFAAIGRHLHERGIPVPRIFAYDRPSGVIVLEDLGDQNLQGIVRRAVDAEEVARHYRTIIDLLITLGVDGAQGFEIGYAYQTPYYDRELILEKESRYFVEAFLNGYLGLEIRFDDLVDEFDLIAQRALEHPYTGLLHRDFQSRNILVRDQNYYFIDFQSARLGPLPYDLASLLIDPYVELPLTLHDGLLEYALERLSIRMPTDKNEFFRAYKYCSINRNLQIMGAFSFLSNVKAKKGFEAYIPPALRSLKRTLQGIEEGECKQLRRLVKGL